MLFEKISNLKSIFQQKVILYGYSNAIVNVIKRVIYPETEIILEQDDCALLLDAYCQPQFRGCGIHNYMNQWRLFAMKEYGMKKAYGIVLAGNRPAIKTQKGHSEFKLCYVRHEDKVLCARIIYVYRGQAADVYAANSFEAMKYSATHFMMESVFEWLKEQGVQTFDFSRISPCIHNANSVYQFKDAAGGYPVQYLGEWIWTKKKGTKLLFCVYNFFTTKHSY